MFMSRMQLLVVHLKFRVAFDLSKYSTFRMQSHFMVLVQNCCWSPLKWLLMLITIIYFLYYGVRMFGIGHFVIGRTKREPKKGRSCPKDSIGG